MPCEPCDVTPYPVEGVEGGIVEGVVLPDDGAIDGFGLVDGDVVIDGDVVVPDVRPESSARAADASIVVATATLLKIRSVLRSMCVVSFRGASAAANAPIRRSSDRAAAGRAHLPRCDADEGPSRIGDTTPHPPTTASSTARSRQASASTLIGTHRRGNARSNETTNAGEAIDRTAPKLEVRVGH